MDTYGPITDPNAPSSKAPGAVEIADPGRVLDQSARERLAARLREVLAILGLGGEVRVRLVGDVQMQAAHARYRADPSTTDVLTFDLSPDPGDAGTQKALDTDLFVCVDQARREAQPRAHSFEDELLLYSLHGVLHCVGYDDHSDEDARRMHEEEDRVLTALGVGAIFSAPPAPDGRGPL